MSRQNLDLPRVILFNRDKKFPLLWQVLGNNYYKKIAFGHHNDPEGKFAATLGFTAREEGKFSKVIVYPAGSSVPILYEGKLLPVRSRDVGSLNVRGVGGNKYEPLAKYFRSIVDGTVDFLKPATESPAKDEL